MFKALGTREILITTLAAAGILMITMGARQSLGLFIGPMDDSSARRIRAMLLNNLNR